MIYLQLFVSYLKIGIFGFGGGYAMLSLIQNEVVVQHAWMSNADFSDIVADSQLTPGPIAIYSATLSGERPSTVNDKTPACKIASSERNQKTTEKKRKQMQHAVHKSCLPLPSFHPL